MKKLLVGVTALIGLVLGLLMPVSVSDAQDTTDVYIVHGLNLNFQDEQTDGGNEVTVCLNDTNPALLTDFAFGQTAGPYALEGGVEVAIDVYEDDDHDCESPSLPPLISQNVTPIVGQPVALVATAAPGEQEFTLAVIPLFLECLPGPDQGRIGAAHAASAGPVDVLVDDEPSFALSFGEADFAELPVGTYSVAVELQAAPDPPIVGPTDIPVDLNITRVIFVVGNLENETPVVPLILDIPVEVCEEPTTTTTTTTTATTPSTTTTTTAAAAAPAQPARAATAQPTFTG